MNEVHRPQDSDLLEQVDEEDTPLLGKSLLGKLVSFNGTKEKNFPDQPFI